MMSKFDTVLNKGVISKRQHHTKHFANPLSTCPHLAVENPFASNNIPQSGTVSPLELDMRRYIAHGAFLAGADTGAETGLRTRVTLSLNLTPGLGGSGFAATDVTKESDGAEAVDEGEEVGVGVVAGVGARSEPLPGTVVGEHDPSSLSSCVDLSVVPGCEILFFVL